MHNIKRRGPSRTSGPLPLASNTPASLLRVLLMRLLLLLDLRVEVLVLLMRVRVRGRLKEAGRWVDGTGREEGGQRGVL